MGLPGEAGGYPDTRLALKLADHQPLAPPGEDAMV
jgi:hypothetical protein